MPAARLCLEWDGEAGGLFWSELGTGDGVPRAGTLMGVRLCSVRRGRVFHDRLAPGPGRDKRPLSSQDGFASGDAPCSPEVVAPGRVRVSLGLLCPGRGASPWRTVSG